MRTQTLPTGADGPTPPRRLFGDRRRGSMGVLGFSSGFPFLFVSVAQSAWLSEAKVPPGLLGPLSEMTLAYKFKFLWAPFPDRYDAPFLSSALRRRRGWIVLSPLGVMLTPDGIACAIRPIGLPGRSPSPWRSVSPARRRIWRSTGWHITVAPVERQALTSIWAEVGWRVPGRPSQSGAACHNADVASLTCRRRNKSFQLPLYRRISNQWGASMKSMMIPTASALLLIAGAATANAAASTAAATDAGPVIQNSQAMAAADHIQTMNMRQQIQDQLGKDGYTAIAVTPSSFFVRAKDKMGNPVAMVIGPDSFTEVTDVMPKTATATTPPAKTLATPDPTPLAAQK